MKISKFVNKLYLGLTLLGGIVGITSCQAGLTYEDAPENIYSEVGISAFNVRARELFENKIWAINYNQWVDNYLSTVVIGGSASMTWTNETGQAYALSDGTLVNPGETVTLKGMMTEETASDAPDGKLYVLHSYVPSHTTYSTPNKGYLFDASKFSGDFELVDPVDNRSQEVVLPIRPSELVVDFTLVDYDACTVEPQDGAPALGVPGDFTQPHRYLVRNNRTHRPEGVEEYRRLYEVRLTFLP